MQRKQQTMSLLEQQQQCCRNSINLSTTTTTTTFSNNKTNHDDNDIGCGAVVRRKNVNYFVLLYATTITIIRTLLLLSNNGRTEAFVVVVVTTKPTTLLPSRIITTKPIPTMKTITTALRALSLQNNNNNNNKDISDDTTTSPTALIAKKTTTTTILNNKSTNNNNNNNSKNKSNNPRRQFVIGTISAVMATKLPIVSLFSSLVANAAYLNPNITDIPITDIVSFDVVLPASIITSSSKSSSSSSLFSTTTTTTNTNTNNNNNVERIYIGLYGTIMPRVVTNFIKLIDGTNPSGVTYQNTTFYRVVSDLSIQGGAIQLALEDSSSSSAQEKNDKFVGQNGVSSYENGIPFEPDNYNIQHSRPGIISMVRTPAGLIDSRFFITTGTGAATWADDRYAAFGTVLTDASFQTIQRIEHVQVKRPSNTPMEPITILNCGRITEDPQLFLANLQPKSSSSTSSSSS